MDTQPLSPEQRNILKLNALMPLVTLSIILILGCLLFMFLFRNFDRRIIGVLAGGMGVLMLAGTIATGRHCYNNYRDWQDGVVQICTDRLKSKRQTTRAPMSFFAEFETLGRLRVMGDVYGGLEVGQSYQVTYSPRTRQIWKVELMTTQALNNV